MTKREARKLLRKRRCKGGKCRRCEYLTGTCDDPDVMEAVKTLGLHKQVKCLKN